MSFEALKFTTAGKTLQLQALAGESLVFTQIQVGEGSINPEDIPALTQLTSLVKAMDIGKCARADTRYTVEGSFRNDEIPHSFYYRELGVFAADPDYPNDRSKDILYAYQNAYDTAEYISISTGEIIEKIIRVNMLVGEAESVSALIDSSTVFVTRNELENTLAGYATTFDAALAQKANSADVTTSLAGKSDTGHTHDDRYYTESETNTLLGGKVGVSDFNSHANNTTVHVTAEERTRWNGKAELTDIPTTLPADGGNADTVDGKHASDFAAASNPVISGTMSLTRSNTTTSNQIFAYQNALRLRCSDTNAADKTYYDIIISPTGLYKEGYSNGTLISKGNLIDGGNADTLDGKHANDFAQMRGDIADCDDAIAFGTYNITPETKNAPTADYYHLVVEPAANGAWIKQTAVLCNADAPLINSFTRININGTWSAWSNIADGGNALTATYASYANYAGTLANTASNICLRSLSSGTAAANTTNCPVGAWYGQYEEV